MGLILDNGDRTYLSLPGEHGPALRLDQARQDIHYPSQEIRQRELYVEFGRDRLLEALRNRSVFEHERTRYGLGRRKSSITYYPSNLAFFCG
jgi:hypothetical protein